MKLPRFKLRKGEDLVFREDVTALTKNAAWQALTEQWMIDARGLNELLLTAPMKEVRGAKGELLAASFDNVRGQLDNMLAVLQSASVLDEAIEADLRAQIIMNKPGGQDNEFK